MSPIFLKNLKHSKTAPGEGIPGISLEIFSTGLKELVLHTALLGAMGSLGSDADLQRRCHLIFTDGPDIKHRDHPSVKAVADVPKVVGELVQRSAAPENPKNPKKPKKEGHPKKTKKEKKRNLVRIWWFESFEFRCSKFFHLLSISAWNYKAFLKFLFQTLRNTERGGRACGANGPPCFCRQNHHLRGTVDQNPAPRRSLPTGRRRHAPSLAGWRGRGGRGGRGGWGGERPPHRRRVGPTSQRR